jgi:uncharacterized membrane protein YecN with MAPEG domain
MTSYEQEQQQAPAPDPDGTARAQARKRLQAKREFGSNLVAYVVVNAFLVAVWAMTGGGYFWPAWVLAGWGIGIVMHAWDAFFRRPITEADVDREMRRTG